jgi:hypothetical protein
MKSKQQDYETFLRTATSSSSRSCDQKTFHSTVQTKNTRPIFVRQNSLRVSQSKRININNKTIIISVNSYFRAPSCRDRRHAALPCRAPSVARPPTSKSSSSSNHCGESLLDVNRVSFARHVCSTKHRKNVRTLAVTTLMRKFSHSFD